MSAKQRKSAAAPEPARKAGDADLALMVFARNGNTDAILKNVAGPLARSRSEATLVVVGQAAFPADNADVQALAQRLTVTETFHAGSFEKASWVYVIDDPGSFNFSQVTGCFTSHRKEFTQGAHAAGSYASVKTGEGFGKRIGFGFFNFIAQLLLPAAVRDHTSGYRFFDSRGAQELIASGCTTQNNMLSYAAYLGQPVNEFKLGAKENQRSTKGIGRIIGQAFSVRKKWFITNAIREWKAGDTSRMPAFRIGFLSFTLFALISMCVLSFDFGMTWDAKRHNTYGYEMLHYYTSFGEDTTCIAEKSPVFEFRYYGEQFNIIAAFLNTYISPFGEFETRHLLNAIYGFLAMLFAALCAKEIGSWRAGFFAFLLIYLSPVFFGHSMNNPTDIPFATGCAIAVYYLVKVLKTLPRPKLSHLFMCGLGIGIAIGARIGGLVLFAYAGLFMGISWLIVIREKGWPAAKALFLPYLRAGVLIVLFGFLIGISLWPFAQQEILTNWYVAYKKSTDASFFTYNHELFEGVRMYMAEVPWYYLPKFIILNAPIAVTAGFALLVLTFFFWKKTFGSWIYIPMLLFILLFPIVYAEYQSMYYYNGWRHYTFVYPTLIVLAALGWELIIAVMKNKALRYAGGAVLGVLLALPAWWMIKNHPNECVYFNEAAGGVNAAYGTYETDYYSNSVRAAAEWLAQQNPNAKLTVAVNNEPLTAAYYGQRINPNINFIWVREYEEQKPEWDYMILTSRTFSRNELLNGAFPPKGTVHKVMADDIPLAVVVKREDWNMPLGYKALAAQKNDSAAWYFTQATKYNPMDEEAWRMAGIAYRNKNSLDTAEQFFNKALEIFPENYSAAGDKGLVYLARKEYDKALPYFKLATHYKDNNTEGYYYAAVCEMQKGNYLAAVPYLENAVKKNGAIYQVFYYLGIAYLNTGNMNKAEDAFTNALTLNPKSADAYLALAEVFKKTNKQAEYEECIRRYQQLGGR